MLLQKQQRLTKSIIGQYESIKSKYPDPFIFFDRGNDIFIYGDDAIKVSDILNLPRLNFEKQKVCFFPSCNLDENMKILVGKGYRVAICQELKKPKRNVTREQKINAIKKGKKLGIGWFMAYQNNGKNLLHPDGMKRGLISKKESLKAWKANPESRQRSAHGTEVFLSHIEAIAAYHIAIKLHEEFNKPFNGENQYNKVKAGNVISFTVSSYDQEKLVGIVEFIDQLGFVTVVDGVQHEIRKLLNIQIIK